MLCKVSKIFFHILKLNTIYLLAFSAVENESKAPCRMQYSLFINPLALHFLNYRYPLDLPVFNPNCKDISHLITTFSSFSNS